MRDFEMKLTKSHFNKIDLIVVFCFAFIVFTSDRVLSIYLGKLLLKSNFRISLLYKGKSSSDIILIGNSRATASLYAPDIEKLTKKNTFQLGYQGMSMNLAEILIKDYYDKNKKPKLIVIEATCLMTDDVLINDLKAYAWLSPRLAEKFKLLDPMGYKLSQLSNLYYFNGEIFLKTLFLLKKPDPYSISSLEMTADMLLTIKKHQIWVSRAENLKALKRIIEFAGSHGSEVRLLLAPVHPNHFKEISNINAWKAEINELLKTGTTSLWDYLEALDDSKKFSDSYHVNYQGSKALLKHLYDDGFFTIPNS
jgi:hypothetical protein